MTGSLPQLYARDTQPNVFLQDLMKELDEKEEVIKSVQDKAERLMLKNHPARLTIEVSPVCFFFCTLISAGSSCVPPCILLPQALT